jgi:hypothetical protein
MEDTLVRILAHERLGEAERIGYQAARLRAARVDVPGETDIASETGPSGQRALRVRLRRGGRGGRPEPAADDPFLAHRLFGHGTTGRDGSHRGRGGSPPRRRGGARRVPAASPPRRGPRAATGPTTARAPSAARVRPLGRGLRAVGRSAAGRRVARPPPRWLALDLVLPLSMLALLVLVVRGAREGAVAGVAAAAAVGAALLGAGPWATLAGIGAGALAAMLVPEVRRPARRSPSPEATR